MKKNNKGFTLAELLIVVAIIAVLVAIAIPVFTSQLEKAREATDAANIRAAYAEVMVQGIDKNSASAQTVALKQQQAKWQNSDLKTGLLQAFGSANVSGIDAADKGKTASVTWVAGTSSKDAHAALKIG